MMYYILGMVSLLFSMQLSVLEPNCDFRYLEGTYYRTFNSSYVANNKLFYVLLLSFLIRRVIASRRYSVFLTCLKLNWSSPLRYSLFRFECNRTFRLMSGLCCWLFLLNFLLITIVNPSLLNPGPSNGRKLTLSYQNVQGLIPFHELGKKNPVLDKTKILELNSYISNFKPGVVLLNETWLNSTIEDTEVLSKELNYKLFRLDRTNKSHPSDPSNPDKFKKNGGGVLIAVNRDLDIESVRVSHKVSAEIIAATLTFKSGKKVIVCTCYRVGTLGDVNQKEINSYLQKLRSRRGISSVVIVGDFNFPSINWENSYSSISVDQSFLDMFCNLGLDQLITEPTHIKGNTLDLLLTDNPRLISNVKVNDGWQLTKSDHFPIKFDVNLRAKKRVQEKRDIYNYKHADWDKINTELSQINWEHHLSCNDVEVGWANFKSILFSITDRHIPKIKLKNVDQPPWFDSETFNLCREKEKFRSKYKESSNPEHYLKFSECRRAFKNLAQQQLGMSPI